MKRKMKRFSAGGMDDYESSDDAKNLIAAAAREKAEAEAPKTKMPDVGEPLKMASFGEAFKEARGRGDKTFEYMGKKYTTEMAKPKAAAPKAETPKPRSFAQRQEDAASKMRSARADQVSGIKKFFTPTADNPRIRRERASMQDIDSKMKKGGAVKASSASKRADGIAQRGKTRGRIV